jgi:hypothetical protein
LSLQYNHEINCKSTIAIVKELDESKQVKTKSRKSCPYALKKRNTHNTNHDSDNILIFQFELT